jgi:phosphoribosyl 1,2-cyclic phosphate phosphodiesterase
MRVEFLGSGGATTIPRPGCDCRLCVEAIERGVPYSRTGPSVFVHGPDVLIDTPEESKDQLIRSRIGDISGCFYSHWHPDHTMGRRVWETRNMDFRRWPPQSQATDIYLPQQVAVDFKTWLGLEEHFSYMARHDLVRVTVIPDGESVQISEARITPFRVAVDYVYAFLFETERERLLIAPDELFRWDPPDLGPLDLAVLPMGVVEFDVFTGERRIPPDHRVLGMEATFADTLQIVRKIGARRTVLTHIEEVDGLGYDDLWRLQVRLQADGLAVEFAWDTMTIDVG